MKVSVSNRQRALAISSQSAREVVNEVLKHENIATHEVAIHFVSEKVICELHDQFFQDPSPTDCITFPVDDPHQFDSETHHMLGEVFICPYTAINYCKKNGGDPFIETTLYLVHGLLHLFGYDDIETKERKKMRQAEKRHLENLLLKGKILK